MFALELATHRRCTPAQPILSALQRYNRRKCAHPLRDLDATVDLSPHSALFSLQLMDLTHGWWSDREDNDIHIFDVLPLAAAISSKLYSAEYPDPDPFPGLQQHAAHLLTCSRPSPHSSPGASLTTLHRCTLGAQFSKLSLRSVASSGQSTPSLEHTRRQLGSKSSTSASHCGVNSNLSSLNARSSHWFLPTCLLMVHKVLLKYTFGTSHSLWTGGPSHVGGSVWFLSCAFWTCLQEAGVRLR